jgi:hypothetical protein
MMYFSLLNFFTYENFDALPQLGNNHNLDPKSIWADSFLLVWYFIFIFWKKMLWLDSFWSRSHKSYRVLFILSYFIQFCHVSNSILDYIMFAISSYLISWTCFICLTWTRKRNKNTKKKTSNILGTKCNFRSFYMPNFFLSNIILKLKFPISCVYEKDIEETVVVSVKMSYIERYLIEYSLLLYFL